LRQRRQGRHEAVNAREDLLPRRGIMRPSKGRAPEGYMFVVDGIPRPAAYVATLIYQIWVEDTANYFVDRLFDRQTQFLPPNVQRPFENKIRLYCESSVLRILLMKQQVNPRFENLVKEFERLIFPPTPTPEGMTKPEAVKSAMLALHRLPSERKELSWARTWLADIGHNETNPATLALLVTLMTMDMGALRELLDEISHPI